jgi:hypothetical protein
MGFNSGLKVLKRLKLYTILLIVLQFIVICFKDSSFLIFRLQAIQFSSRRHETEFSLGLFRLNFELAV